MCWWPVVRSLARLIHSMGDIRDAAAAWPTERQSGGSSMGASGSAAGLQDRAALCVCVGGCQHLRLHPAIATQQGSLWPCVFFVCTSAAAGESVL